MAYRLRATFLPVLDVFLRRGLFKVRTSGLRAADFPQIPQDCRAFALRRNIDDLPDSPVSPSKDLRSLQPELPPWSSISLAT